MPNDRKPTEGEEAAAAEAVAQAARKEKSVLQAKLTKLAIQIGYAGTRRQLLSSVCVWNCNKLQVITLVIFRLIFLTCT